jgi:hypothetical protein
MSEPAELVPAGDPSPAAAQEAHDVDQRIRLKVRQMRGLWVELAAELHDFHDRKLWRALGCDSFEAWLNDPEFEGDLGRRWVYELIAVYEQLVVERGVDPSRLQRLHVSKVREVLPAIRRQQAPLDEALADAETLSRPDLEIRYRGVILERAGRRPGRHDRRRHARGAGVGDVRLLRQPVSAEGGVMAEPLRRCRTICCRPARPPATSSRCAVPRAPWGKEPLGVVDANQVPRRRAVP